mgnify:CR=1 FL=1
MRPSAGGAPGPADPSGRGSPVREGRSAVPQRRWGESPGNAQQAWRSTGADSFRGARVDPRKTVSATAGRSPPTRLWEYLRLTAVAGVSAVTDRWPVHARLRRTSPPQPVILVSGKPTLERPPGIVGPRSVNRPATAQPVRPEIVGYFSLLVVASSRTAPKKDEQAGVEKQRVGMPAAKGSSARPDPSCGIHIVFLDGIDGIRTNPLRLRCRRGEAPRDGPPARGSVGRGTRFSHGRARGSQCRKPPQGETLKGRRIRRSPWLRGRIPPNVSGHVVLRSYLTGSFARLRSRLGDG